MNKTIAYFFLLVTVVLFIGAGVLWQERKRDVSTPGTNRQYYKIVSLRLPDTLSFAGEPVPLDIFYVREALDREIMVNTYWHSSTLQLLKKANRWFPMMDTILKNEGIHPDFLFMPVIESGLSNAVSPAGAAGFWQLLKGTAKEYGLEVNKQVDERYNVQKSTHAACRYLKKSYEHFHSWALVVASYNAGRRGIDRLMKKQKSSNFYDLLVADETSRYLYRMLAFKLIFSDPERYGFYLDESEEYAPIPVTYVTVDTTVKSWADFAHQHQISYKLLKYFNPWLRQTYLKNRKHRSYTITLPEAPYNLTVEKFGGNE